MKKQIEIVKFAGRHGSSDIYMLGRDAMEYRTAANVLDLQNQVIAMVKAVKALPATERKAAADKRIETILSLSAWLTDVFDNIEQTIREYARILWTQK